MAKQIWLWVGLVWLVPGFASAAVLISEVAWMGTAESANHEWIELYNPDENGVVVDGWSLSDGNNLNIGLFGTIPPQSFAVLERTSNDSAPGTAFLIYTGALVNTGATLTLRDEKGVVVDQVLGGENWENIGGDNVTKDTAQFTGAKWVTDRPTPGNTNGTGRVVAPETNGGSGKTTTVSTQTTTNTEKKSDPKPKFLTDPETSLELEIYAPVTAYVNQPVNFSGTGFGVGPTIINSLQYLWNFGDSFGAGGKEVTHTYQFAGTYVVTLNAKFAKRDVTVRREIKILPVTFSLSISLDGDWQLNNDAPYEVNISGYQLKGGRTVTFPNDTIILPKATITVARARLQKANAAWQPVVLYDNAGKALATTAFSSEVSSPFLEKVAADEMVVRRAEVELPVGLVSRVETEDGTVALAAATPPPAPPNPPPITTTPDLAIMLSSAMLAKQFDSEVEERETADETSQTTGLVVINDEGEIESVSSSDIATLPQSWWSGLMLVILLVIISTGLFLGKKEKTD